MTTKYNHIGIWNHYSGKSGSSGPLWDAPATDRDRAERCDVREPWLYAARQGEELVWLSASELPEADQRRHGAGPIVEAERARQVLASEGAEYEWTVGEGDVVRVRVRPVRADHVAVTLDGVEREYSLSELRLREGDPGVVATWAEIHRRAVAIAVASTVPA